MKRKDYNVSNPLNPNSASKDHFCFSEKWLNFLHPGVLEQIILWNCSNNNDIFLVIYHPPKSSSSTTSRELRQQIPACGG